VCGIVDWARWWPYLGHHLSGNRRAGARLCSRIDRQQCRSIRTRPGGIVPHTCASNTRPSLFSRSSITVLGLRDTAVRTSRLHKGIPPARPEDRPGLQDPFARLCCPYCYPLASQACPHCRTYLPYRPAVHPYIIYN